MVANTAHQQQHLIHIYVVCVCVVRICQAWHARTPRTHATCSSTRVARARAFGRCKSVRKERAMSSLLSARRPLHGGLVMAEQLSQVNIENVLLADGSNNLHTHTPTNIRDLHTKAKTHTHTISVDGFVAQLFRFVRTMHISHSHTQTNTDNNSPVHAMWSSSFGACAILCMPHISQ